jgi:1-acyl-sn-glycerol-3-phosphate acyltransferase
MNAPAAPATRGRFQRSCELPPRLTANRNFLLLWAAYGISAVGDHLSEMALIKERGGFERTDITRLQALLTFGFFLPFVIFGPLGGWWADRFSRRCTMIVADVLRAAVMASLALALPGAARTVITFLADRGLGDFSIVVPLFVTGVFAAFFSPARQAILPTLIRDDQLVRANALISALGTIGAIFSAWLGGILVDRAEAGHFDLHWNYRIDAMTFLASAALLLLMNPRHIRARSAGAVAGVWTPLKEGFRYVRQHQRVLTLIGLATVFWAAAGVVISIVPALVREVFGGRFSDAGLYRGLIGAGLACGAALMSAVGPGMPLQLRVLAGLAAGTGWILALAGAYLFHWGRFLTGLCLFGMGASGAAVLVTVMAALQRFVPDSRRGRVFGVTDTATMAAIVVTTGILGLAPVRELDRHVPLLLALTGLGLLAATLAAWRYYRAAYPFPAIVVLLWLIQRFYAQFWLRVRRIGPCTVPRTGPVILAINHTAGIDPMAIFATCTYRLPSFVVAEEYYRLPMLGWFQRLAGCVPVNRARPGKKFLSACLRLLRNGGCLAIFPEGTWPDPGQEPLRARPGVGVLALRSGAAVIPCHISGTTYAFSPFKSYFLRHRVQVRYGRPVDLTAFAGRERDPQAAQEAADLIMATIRKLGAQDLPHED